MTALLTLGQRRQAARMAANGDRKATAIMRIQHTLSLFAVRPPDRPHHYEHFPIERGTQSNHGFPPPSHLVLSMEGYRPTVHPPAQAAVRRKR